MTTVFISGIEKPLQSKESMFDALKKRIVSFTEDCFRSRSMVKPDDVHLPDRVWRRHSALIMCMNEQKKY